MVAAIGTAAWAYDAPSELYVVGQVNGTNFGSRIPMHKDGNKFIANVFIDAVSGYYGEFKFTSSSNVDNWNNNEFYFANGQDWTFKLSEVTSAPFVYNNSNDYKWKLITGQYILTVDFDNTTVSIQPGDMYIIGQIKDKVWDNNFIQLKQQGNFGHFVGENIEFIDNAEFVITAKAGWNDDATFKYAAHSDGEATVNVGEAKAMNYKYNINFKAPEAGVYDVVVDVDNYTVSLLKFGEDSHIYFTNDKDWADVYAYCWKDGSNLRNANWPGVKVEKLAADGNEYYYNVSRKYDHVIFTNGIDGDANKTSDLDVKNGYVYDASSNAVEMAAPASAGDPDITDTDVNLTTKPGCVFYYNVGTTNFGGYDVKVADAAKVISRAANEIDPTTAEGWTKSESNELSINKADVASKHINYVIATPTGKLSSKVSTHSFDANGTLTGIDDIAVDAVDAAPVYFNLQGVRVANPAAGQLYIVKKGNKVSKVIL